MVLLDLDQFFPCPFVLFLSYPLAMLYPWQLLRRRSSLVADDVTGYRVVNIVLRNRVYDDISSAIEPICLGYLPFHSVEFVSQQPFSFVGLIEVGCLTDLFQEFEVAH